MKAGSAGDLFMPWAGLALGTLGFFLTHQIGSDSTFQDCRFSSPGIVILATLLGLVVIGVGALGSWRVYTGEGETAARRLVAAVGLLACALFTMGVILPSIAALVIPRCWG